MATKTTNYNLIKPDLTDDADIRVINGNMDVLDNQLKSISDKAGTATNNAYTTISVSDNYEWKFTKGSGANVTYDTIKTANNSKVLTSSTATYRPNTKADNYGKLEYWYGTVPKMGTSSTIDGGNLKFNHWGATPWATMLTVPNNPNYRPYLSYMNGVAGTDYSQYRELAYKTDVDGKLDKSGGNITGALYTNNSIYRSNNNGVLVLSGSTDSTHGGRINLSGEKQADSGLVKITADNGTVSNVFEVTTAGGGSRYNFNGLTTYMNSNDDHFRLGGDEAYLRLSKSDKWLSTNAGGMTINGINCTFNTTSDIFKLGNAQNYLAYNTDGSLYLNYKNAGNKLIQVANYTGTGSTWYLETDSYLIQGGTWIPTESDKYINVTLSRPYSDTNYTLLVGCNTTRNSVGLSDRNPSARKISGTTIQLDYYINREVAWLTMGVK